MAFSQGRIQKFLKEGADETKIRTSERKSLGNGKIKRAGGAGDAEIRTFGRKLLRKSTKSNPKAGAVTPTASLLDLPVPFLSFISSFAIIAIAIQSYTSNRMHLKFPINSKYMENTHGLLKDIRLRSSIEQFPVSYEIISDANFSNYIDLLFFRSLSVG
jgi:hypothetical protein